MGIFKVLSRTKLTRSLFLSLFAFNEYNRDLWVAKQAENISPKMRVLDAGAGAAPYRDLFAHCHYQTQDFLNLADEQLRGGQYHDVDFVSDLAHIPVSDNSFDAILCTEALEHHPEPILVIKEFSRILAPGGKLILTAPLGSGIHQEPWHFYGGFTKFWYEKFLQEFGFSDILIEPNAGSLRHFSQESIRFLQITHPFKLEMNLPQKVIWFPVWLTLLPFLAVVIPALSLFLDTFDQQKRFTVGYHVTAIWQDAHKSTGESTSEPKVP